MTEGLFFRCYVLGDSTIGARGIHLSFGRGAPLYHELAWMWLWLKLATGAFHWHDWGGPGRGSAPEAPEHGCGTLCPVFLLPDLSGPVFSLVSSVFLSPCSS